MLVTELIVIVLGGARRGTNAGFSTREKTKCIALSSSRKLLKSSLETLNLIYSKSISVCAVFNMS
jgi:hypothetical protein